MIVYASDRSGKVPRKPKRKKTFVLKASCYAGFRAEDNSSFKSAMNEEFKRNNARDYLYENRLYYVKV